jgi:class 3 adenylate cyclase
METAVLFADISGFTSLGEACAKQGVRGNEELAFCINRYMEGMVKNFGKYGGDIIKFVGDALIVMWPSEKGANKESNTVRKAI